MVAIALLTASFYGGWQLRALKAQRDGLHMQAEYAQQRAAAQQQARQREHVLQQKMEEIQHETQQQLAEITIIERAAADSRVRELAKQYAAGNRTGTDSTSSDRCQTERTRAAVLAELLGELDELAAVFASEADRRRIAGLACEKAYEQVRKSP